MKAVMRHLRRVSLLSAGGSMSDGQLLESFATRREPAAFEALLRRHGPMVLGVCQRVLGNRHDAEDAFQATFLVLVRKAAALRSRELIGNWLYGVAYRTARRARAMRAQRRQKERVAAERSAAASAGEETEHGLLPLLDQELSRLSDKYRVPVVLCDLQSKSRKEVAGLLGIPEGTLSSRLAYARKQLAKRLSRPGLLLSPGVLAAMLCHNAASARLPAPLVVSTTQAALGQIVPGAAVISLTEGVVRAMLLTKLKVAWAVALAVGVSAGVAGWAYRAMAQSTPRANRAAQSKQAPDGLTTPRANDRAAVDDLEALRLEIEALRKGLQATRTRVKVLEEEVRTLRGANRRAGKAQDAGAIQAAHDRDAAQQMLKKYLEDKQALRGLRWLKQRQDGKLADNSQALDLLEQALKRLKDSNGRRQPDDKEAVKLLEQALKRLKERPRQEDPTKENRRE